MHFKNKICSYLEKSIYPKTREWGTELSMMTPERDPL